MFNSKKEKDEKNIYVVKPILCRQKKLNDWKKEYLKMKYDYCISVTEKQYIEHQKKIGNDYLFKVGEERYFSNLEEMKKTLLEEARFLSEFGYYNWLLVVQNKVNNIYSHLSTNCLELYVYDTETCSYKDYSFQLDNSVKYIKNQFDLIFLNEKNK